jgi:hypothetical protein
MWHVPHFKDLGEMVKKCFGIITNVARATFKGGDKANGTNVARATI